MIPIGDGVFARRATPAPARPRRSRGWSPGPDHADHPGAHHRDQLRLARRRSPDRRETRGRPRPDPAGCRSGTCRARPAADLHRELAQQARLQRSDADDEERAEADGEQDHARLVARPWSDAAPRGAAGTCATARAARAASRARGRPGAARAPGRRSRRRRRARPCSDAACHAASADERAGDQRDRGQPEPVDPAACVDSSRRSSDGLTRRTCSSGTSEKSSETSTPIADALQRGAPASRRSAPRPGSSVPEVAAGPGRAESRPPPTRAIATPSRLPARPGAAPAARRRR